MLFLVGDIDVDGILDDFEICYQLDLLDVIDVDQDNDCDGYSNRDEVFWDINLNDVNFLSILEVYFLEFFEQFFVDYWLLSVFEGVVNWQVNLQWVSDGE